MTSSKKPTDQERRDYESAVDNFMDLLARVIAREHLRRSGDEANEAIGSTKDQGDH